MRIITLKNKPEWCFNRFFYPVAIDSRIILNLAIKIIQKQRGNQWFPLIYIYPIPFENLFNFPCIATI